MFLWLIIQQEYSFLGLKQISWIEVFGLLCTDHLTNPMIYPVLTASKYQSGSLPLATLLYLFVKFKLYDVLFKKKKSTCLVFICLPFLWLLSKLYHLASPLMSLRWLGVEITTNKEYIHTLLFINFVFSNFSQCVIWIVGHSYFFTRRKEKPEVIRKW